MTPTVGITIEGGYVIEQILFDDGVYQWTQARSPSGAAFLQLPSIVLSSDEIKSLLAAFQALDAKAIRSLLTPQQKLTSGAYPFIGVYPRLPLEFLADSNTEPEPNVIVDRWLAACLIIRGLHKAQLVHGHIDARSFRVDGTTVLLSGFGFAPLIASGNRVALAAARECLAPEIRDGGQPTKESDIYAFGKLVLQTFPHLRGTPWAETVCATDPARRCSIDDIRKELGSLLPRLVVPEPEPPGPELPGPPPLPKEYPVTVTAAPSGSGTVSGGGWYYDGTTATLHAKPSLGYAFSHWSGDVSGPQNPITKQMTENLSVTAHFVPDSPSPPPSFSVAVTVEPTGSGTVAGTGSYERNLYATLKATPAVGYTFSHWSGDLVGSDNPTRQSITKDVAATAHFRPDDPIFTVNISQNLPFGGSVKGAGSYKTGTTVVLTATPNNGFLFTGWSGDLTGPGQTQSMQVTKNITTQANFKARPRFPIVRLLVIAALVIAFFVWKHSPSPPPPPIREQSQKDEKNAKDALQSARAKFGQLKADPPSAALKAAVLDDCNQATKYADKSIAEDASNSEAVTDRSDANVLVADYKAFLKAQSLKDYDKADTIFDTAQANFAQLKANPNSAALRADIVNECRQTAAYAKKATAEDSTNRDAWYDQCAAYFLMADYRDFKTVWDQANVRFPGDHRFSKSGALYQDYIAHMKKGQPERKA